MKSFINQPSNIISQSLQGHLATHPHLTMLDNFPQIKVIARKNWDKSKVALITGGGSGHQPAHVGYIGKGMLTAAVCGQIFASPSVDAVLSAILALTGQMGCLLIVKNYTGDRLNFGLAAQQARALGYKVQMVIVGDDISIEETKRKRGIAGTVFIHKIAGYYAEMGRTLEEVTKITKAVCSKIFTIGLSIDQHSLYAKPKKQRLSPTQAQLGLGIHGEPGSKIISFQKADTLMNTVANELMKCIQKEESKKQYMMLMNNLGFVTPIEMDVLMNGFLKTDVRKFVKYVVGPGHFMTALNMAGFSVSLVQVNQQTAQALLYQVDAPAWKQPQILSQPSTLQTPSLPQFLPYKPSSNPLTSQIINKIANLLISRQSQINTLDSVVGDSDTGTTLASIGKKLLHYSDQLPYDNTKELLESIGKILAREGGGSIGVLLSIFFIASANFYESGDKVSLGKCFLKGLKKMEEYGGAGKGSRTMVDALQPAFEKMAENGTLQQIAAMAKQGAESTKKISKTQFGRSSYVPSQVLEGAIDPGAYSISIVFNEIANFLL